MLATHSVHSHSLAVSRPSARDEGGASKQHSTQQSAAVQGAEHFLDAAARAPPAAADSTDIFPDPSLMARLPFTRGQAHVAEPQTTGVRAAADLQRSAVPANPEQRLDHPGPPALASSSELAQLAPTAAAPPPVYRADEAVFPPPAAARDPPPPPVVPRVGPSVAAAAAPGVAAHARGPVQRRLLVAVREFKSNHALFKREVARMLHSSGSALDALSDQVVRATRRAVEEGAQGERAERWGRRRAPQAHKACLPRRLCRPMDCRPAARCSRRVSSCPCQPRRGGCSSEGGARRVKRQGRRARAARRCGAVHGSRM